MKSSSILLGVMLILGVVMGAIVFSGGEPKMEAGQLGGGEALAKVAGDSRQTEGLGLTGGGPSDGAPAAKPASADRVAVKDPTKKEAASSTSSAPKGPFLRGVVTDSNGLVIPDATLKFTGEGPAATLLNLTGSPFVERTESGSGGEYKVTRRGLLSSDVTVYVRARGYLPLKVQRTLEDREGDLWLEDFQLERGVVLGGVVRDATGAPVAGAKVLRTTPDEEGRFSGAFFFGRGQDDVESAEDGSFELPNEEAGPFVLLVTHDDYPRARLEGDAPYPGYEDTGLVVTFPATATISGKLAGMPLGRKGVVVHAVPSETATDSDTLGPMEVFMAMAGEEGSVQAKAEQNGDFKLTGVDPGRSYELMATIEGGVMSQVRCSDRVRVAGGDEDVRLAWDSGASVSFKLVDAKTQKPIKASTVNYRWNDEDYDGFQIGSAKRDFQSSHIELTELRPNPAPAKLELMVSAEGYLELKPDPVKIEEDSVIDLGTLELTPAPIVRVHVVDAATGKDMRRARVSLTPDLEDQSSMRGRFGGLNPKGSKGRTEKDGTCELGACASETATLTVRKSGYSDYRQEEIAMPKGGELELEVRMSSGGELSITVVDSKGDPVGKAQVEYKGPNDAKGSATASSKGRIKLKDLTAGDYQLLAKRPSESRGVFSVQFDSGNGPEGVWQRVPVAAGAEQSVTLRVPQETRLTGVVTANGAPLGGATVTFVAGPEAKPGEADEEAMRQSFRNFRTGDSTDTKSDGRFELGNLSPGSHRLKIDAGPGAPAHVVGIELVEGANETSIALEVGSLSGRILDSKGAPLAGAMVKASASGEAGAGPSNDVLMLGSMFGRRAEGGVKTDASGHFELTGLDPKFSYRLGADADGFIDTVGSMDFEVGTRDAELVLERGASIRVKLTGKAKGWTAVIADSEEGGGSRSEWARGSSVLFKDINPGKWKLRIQDRGDDSGPGSPVEVTAIAGETVEVTLER